MVLLHWVNVIMMWQNGDEVLIPLLELLGVFIYFTTHTLIKVFLSQEKITLFDPHPIVRYLRSTIPSYASCLRPANACSGQKIRGPSKRRAMKFIRARVFFSILTRTNVLDEIHIPIYWTLARDRSPVSIRRTHFWNFLYYCFSWVPSSNK